MIQLSDVWYMIGGNQILAEISVQVDAGEFVCIVGPSGAGKSTILRLVHMEIYPTRGKVIVADYNAQKTWLGQIRQRKVIGVFYFRRYCDNPDYYCSFVIDGFIKVKSRRNLSISSFSLATTLPSGIS